MAKAGLTLKEEDLMILRVFITRVLIPSNCSRIRFLLKRHNLLFEGF